MKTMRMYDLKGIKLEKIVELKTNNGTFYYDDAPRTLIQVPGLADGRPSVLPHDSMYRNK